MKDHETRVDYCIEDLKNHIAIMSGGPQNSKNDQYLLKGRLDFCIGYCKDTKIGELLELIRSGEV